MLAKPHIIVKYAVVSKGEARISNLAGERVIVSVIELVTLGRHSGMPHDNIAVLVQSKVYLVSGVRALVN